MSQSTNGAGMTRVRCDGGTMGGCNGASGQLFYWGLLAEVVICLKTKYPAIHKVTDVVVA